MWKSKKKNGNIERFTSYIAETPYPTMMTTATAAATTTKMKKDGKTGRQREKEKTF